MISGRLWRGVHALEWCPARDAIPSITVCVSLCGAAMGIESPPGEILADA
jgi:hypothetical protein